MNTFRGEDRYWCITAHPTLNLFAAGPTLSKYLLVLLSLVPVMSASENHVIEFSNMRFEPYLKKNVYLKRHILNLHDTITVL